MDIKGTATISLETLDELREAAKTADKMLKANVAITEEVMAAYSFDTEEYHEELKKIEANDSLTDKQFSKKVSEAMVKHLKIVVDADALKKLIRAHIDSDESEEHMDIKKATKEELEGIQVILKGRQEQTGKPDTNLCRVCEEYMTDEECEHLKDGSCPAAGLMERLKTAEKTIAAKEKAIKERDKKIREIRKQMEESETKRSYMVDPMAIGDRHEMGG